jgi:hypothetical protein
MQNVSASRATGEVLWRFDKTGRMWSCELQRRSEGIQALISRDGIPLVGQSFGSRERAVAWANDKRREIRGGV